LNSHLQGTGLNTGRVLRDIANRAWTSVLIREARIRSLVADPK
jgi:hypothetical protein